MGPKTLPFDLLVLDAGGRVLVAHGGSVVRDIASPGCELRDAFGGQPLLGDILGSLLDEARAAGRLADTVVWLGASGSPDRCCRVSVVPLTTPGDAQFLAVLEDQSRETQRDLQLGLLRRIVDRLAASFDLDRLLFSILTGVTAGHGLGFSRALLLLIDGAGEALVGRMAVGATSREEALRIWSDIDRKNLTLDDLLAVYDRDRGHVDTTLNQIVRSLRIPLEGNDVLGACLRKRGPIVVDDARTDSRVHPHLAEIYESGGFVAVPLLGRDRSLGVLVADRQWSDKPIASNDVEVLRLFGGQAGVALDSAEAHRRALRSEKLAAVGQISAKLAHEIRNPLGIIGGFADGLLREGPSSPHFERNLRIVVDEVRRLERMLRDVNAFTRLSVPRLENLDLNALAVDAMEQVAAVSAREGGRIRFETELDATMNCVSGDPAQLRQVLLNLLQNAVEAITATGTDGIVRVVTRREPEKVRLEIHDTGPGIPPETMAKILEPFHSTKPRGTGLGLAISAQILEDHGGSLIVQSDPGGGTRAVATLPAQTIDGGT
ncbi:MAG: GAF domain-containing protein [Planctomycetes bacterium]|nr:GAF domain-containing protein [Planctomycetota bacterium]MBI3847415.1 GAF domain-containing protein [Planctomycetota bacterium]